jgi:myo-inositol-1(or 4)-monophosphatase
MRVPFIGVIYNPFLDQLYSARKGHGAFLNLTTPLPLHAPSVLPSLSSALIGIEWGSDRSKDVMAKKSNSFVKLAGNPKEILGGKMAHGFRSMGSAALNYCQVASGSLDMYWCVFLRRVFR